MSNKYEELSKEFQFIDEFDLPLAKDINVKRFVHKKSGLTLILNYCPGPKCNASIVVPTESINDKGLPHTLEHLIFTGCNDIPYREFLEVLSNRCLSAPCNAYTAEDHTCYSIDSIGPEAILTYLPIYLKYVLTPTLKENDFITEIYHIDSNGKDQGVVLCEMQARENTADDLLEINMCRNMFEGSGYQYSYGGKTSEIATLNNEMVRDYHGKFYDPKFMTLVIQGCIDIESLFKVLDKVDFVKSPFHKQEDVDFVPWKNEIPPLLKSKSSFVPYPSESETGSVSIGWRGPPINDIFKITALTVLLRYLQDNASSPLQQRFVNKTIPIANSVYCIVHEVKDTKVVIEFSGVPIKYNKDKEPQEEEEKQEKQEEQQNGKSNEKVEEDKKNEEEGEEEESEEESEEEESESEDDNNLEEEKEKEKNCEDEDDIDEGDNNLFNERSIYDRLIKVLKDLKTNGFPEEDSIKKVIEKEMIKMLEVLEEDPLSLVFGSLLCCIVFPSSSKTINPNGDIEYSDIKSRFFLKPVFEELLEKPSQFWFDLLDEFFIDKPYVEILLKPDSKLSETIANETTQRMKDTIEKNGGEEGMKIIGEKLKCAIDSSKSFPQELLTETMSKIESFDINKIPLIKIDTILNRAYTQNNPNPFTVQTLLVPSHFIHSTIIFHVQQSLPDHLRPWLTLFQIILFETDLLVDSDQVVDNDEINKSTTATTTKEKSKLLIPYKKVCKSMAEQVLSFEAVLGFSNSTFTCSSSELFRITASCQVEKFDNLIYWIFNGLFNFSLNLKRLSTLLTNIYSSLQDVENDSTTMCGLYSLHKLFPNPKISNEANISIFKQKEFLKSIISIIKSKNQIEIDYIFNMITQVRDCIISNPEAMFIQISHSPLLSNQSFTQRFIDKWNEYLENSNIKLNKKRKPQQGQQHDQQQQHHNNNNHNNEIENQQQNIPFFQPLERLKTKIPTPFSEQLIIKGSESNSLLQYVTLPISSTHEDYPAVSLLCNIFNGKEGEIRKKGYSYGHSLLTDTTKGTLIFGLTESSSPIKALAEFHKWLKNVRDRPTEIITQQSIETAICSEIYDFYSTRSAPQELVIESYINIFKGHNDFQQSIDFLNRFKVVTYDQIINVFNKYFIQFLDPNHLFLSLTVNPSSAKPLETELKETFDVSITSKYPSQLYIPFNYEEYKLSCKK
ncbi:hypothetical protein ACTFIR_001359 [Dictyostelium discoideum]